MKLLFLDIDGVLNSELWYRSNEHKILPKETKHQYEISKFDPRCIELLNNITEKTGAKIVVSSSWRKGRSEKAMIDLLEEVGVSGEVIGCTPFLSFNGDYKISVPRGCEIQMWLEMNKEIPVENYVIIDDDSDMLYRQRDKFFLVDGYCGLTPNIVYKIVNFLNN